jgi:hypothetical protein
MKDGKRDYRREYDKYAGRASEIHKRVLRNKARRYMMKLGRVHKGDDKDVDHRIALSKGGSGSIKNLRVQSERANRSFRRTRAGAIR